MNKIDDRLERGQSLVIIALMVVVLMGILALVIDGGNAYAQRRAAQNAADAGALAGAASLCEGDIDNAPVLALDYAVTRNEAVTATVSLTTERITVTTFIPHNTFFAGLLGQGQVTATASAAAGCFSPCTGVGVLPVAWACSPPAGNPGSNECVLEYAELGDPDPPIYIIMDSQASGDDFYCQDPPNSGTPVGALDCDLNDDGYNELLAGGNRSWIDLSGGGGGASDLVNWVVNGYSGEIRVHTWFGGQPGVANTVFQAADDRRQIDPIVILPVFDMYCEGVPDVTSECIPNVHPEDIIVYGGGTNALYYHVISYSAFVITCVDAPGVPGPTCPGKQAALDINPSLPNNVKTIEGYFIEGYVPGLGGACDLGDAGVYTIYLDN